jgi:hypothetical protein
MTVLTIVWLIGLLAYGAYLHAKDDVEPTSAKNEQDSIDQAAEELRTSFVETQSRTVRYFVDGTAKGADVTFSTATGISQRGPMKVPIVNQDGEPGWSIGVLPSGSPVSISAQNHFDTGQVRCRIQIGDRIVRKMSPPAPIRSPPARQWFPEARRANELAHLAVGRNLWDQRSEPSFFFVVLYIVDP